ncbi:MAG: 16S rRNA (uracil(1498)-N(3))-methyltransferase, partial [Sphingopyxis sp.]|nr:16S rRNA (uracil(1498)-N(3))-methyltransferase [Sphingopyxis sp.]
MTAIPAWPPASTPRLYVETPLADDTAVLIEGNAAHYLRHVMRIADGAPVRLFDDIGGEWLASCAAAGKRAITASVTRKLREREAVPDFWLCFAPIQIDAVDD